MWLEVAKHQKIIKRGFGTILFIALMLRGGLQVLTIAMDIKPMNPMITVVLHFLIIVSGSVLWVYRIEERVNPKPLFWMSRDVVVILVITMLVSNSIYMWAATTMERPTYIYSPEETQCLVISEGMNAYPSNYYAFASKVAYRIFKQDLHYKFTFVDKWQRDVFKNNYYEAEWLNEKEVIIHYCPAIDVSRDEWSSLCINLEADD